MTLSQATEALARAILRTDRVEGDLRLTCALLDAYGQELVERARREPEAEEAPKLNLIAGLRQANEWAQRNPDVAQQVADNPSGFLEPPAQRFTAPEPLPVGRRVRIVEVSNEDASPCHMVGEALMVVRDAAQEAGEIEATPERCGYLARHHNGSGTWVRTVELLDE